MKGEDEEMKEDGIGMQNVSGEIRDYSLGVIGWGGDGFGQNALLTFKVVSDVSRKDDGHSTSAKVVKELSVVAQVLAEMAGA